MDTLGSRRGGNQDITASNKRKKQSNQRTDRKKKEEMKEPIKVVHFSDPIRIITTPSEFKGRVQELTGRFSTAADSLLLEQNWGGKETACGDHVRVPLDLGIHDEDDGGLFPDACGSFWESLLADGVWPLGAL